MSYFYQMLQGHFRNLLLVKIAEVDRLLSDLSEQDVKRLRDQIGEVSRETLLRLLDILMAEEENVRRSQSPRLNVEQTVVRMAYLPPLIPIEDILEKMEELRRKIAIVQPERAFSEGGKKTPDPVGRHASPVVEPVSRKSRISGNEDPETLWDIYKNFVKTVSNPLWSKIDAGKVLGCDKGFLKIGFRKDYIFLDEIKKQQQERLSALFVECFGGALDLRIEGLAAEEGENRSVENRNGRMQEIKREALNQPLLQTILDVFEGAEVKEVIPLEEKPKP
jgi:DNA polymerase-3 subunit gamma/tau